MKKSIQEIAESWYQWHVIAQAIKDQNSYDYDGPKIPENIYSREFAKWLTEQYQLAMIKGYQLAQEENFKD